MVAVGERYGRLTVKELTRSAKGVMATCVCDCGNLTTIPQERLPRGATKSCGCLRKEMLMNGLTHRKHGGRGTRLYGIWKAMRERCNVPTCSNYSKYGGRGIHICKEWDDYSVFQKWAEESGYEDHLTIDRIDVNGSYSPQNCRWATYTEQARNKRNTRYLTVNGVSLPMATWAERTGISEGTLHARLKRGWSEEKAVSTPLRKGGSYALLTR